MTKTILMSIAALGLVVDVGAQDFWRVPLQSEVNSVEPMTGFVFWVGQRTNTDAIQLEFSYMRYDEVVDDDGHFRWDAVEAVLDSVASRNHQAILRFYYTYPGQQTTVPGYIKALPDYEETVGWSEGQKTWYPDWSHPELKRFHLRFYRAFAERYDGDPRLAFLQTGFGLWAEYHIYDGPYLLGKTFPDEAFQRDFLMMMDSAFQYTPWSISIDAADPENGPFDTYPELLSLRFGNFDDSFMAEEHPQVNAPRWAFFDTLDRYRWAPAGGEFSYYSDYDQMHVLDLPDGAYGVSYEEMARRFSISYMIGNDQPDYQPMSRIREASQNTGYHFEIVDFLTRADSSIVYITNKGTAPIYYPAYVSVDGVRSTTSIQGLMPGDTLQCGIAAGRAPHEGIPMLRIESDFILPTQTIEYDAQILTTHIQDMRSTPNKPRIVLIDHGTARLCQLDWEASPPQKCHISLTDIGGHVLLSKTTEASAPWPLPPIPGGIYFLTVEWSGGHSVHRLWID